MFDKITNQIALKQTDIDSLYYDFLEENQSVFDYAHSLLEDSEDGFDHLDASDYVIDNFEHWLYEKIENTELNEEYLQKILSNIYEHVSAAFS